MSTRGGNDKKKGQKHQNTFAFKHNKNSKLTIKIKASPLDNLCKRCFDILEWKINFRKYKPLSAPTSCNACHQKTIIKAYRTLCDLCAVPNKLCTKCAEFVENYVKDTRKKSKREQNGQLMSLIESLPERYKKTALRKIDQGENLQYDPIKGIVNSEGQIIVDIDHCKDKVKDVVKIESDDEEIKEESKKVEKNGGQSSNKELDDDLSEEEGIEGEEYEDVEENEKEEEKEEEIDTFKDKKTNKD